MIAFILGFITGIACLCAIAWWDARKYPDLYARIDQEYDRDFS